MTRVVVDRDRCMGSGVCELEAPEVFRVREDGVLEVRDGEPADPAGVETAVRACPTGALSWAD